MNKTNTKSRIQLLAAPYGIWAAGFIIIPLIMILFYAFTDQESGRFTFSNFSGVFQATTMKALFLALGLALLSTLLCLLLAYPLALILSGAHIGSAAFIVLLFVLPMWMNFLLRTFAWQTILENNGVINSVLTFFGMKPLHLINTPAAIVFGMVYNFLPFMVLPIYNALIKISPEVFEAARDLGAGAWTTFCKVTVPLSVSGIISGITMVFVPSLTTFVISDLLGGGKILLIGNLIEQEFKQLNDWNVGSAMSVILMIFIVFSMLLSARYDKEGEGGVF